MRRLSVLFAAVASACTTLSPAGAQVAVFRAPLETAPSRPLMPAGCTLVMRERPVPMPELDLEGQKDPFRVKRNAAGDAGANALLVLSRMTISRHDSECPAALPITDCPPSFGAWYRVVFEQYRCSSDALDSLLHPGPNSPP